MRRRELLKYAGATALAAPFIRAARAGQGPVKVGVVGAKTGTARSWRCGQLFLHRGNCGRMRSIRPAAFS